MALLTAVTAAGASMPFADSGATAIKRILDALPPTTRIATERLRDRTRTLEEPAQPADRRIRRTIEAAVQRGVVVKISYQDLHGTVTERSVGRRSRVPPPHRRLVSHRLVPSQRSRPALPPRPDPTRTPHPHTRRGARRRRNTRLGTRDRRPSLTSNTSTWRNRHDRCENRRVTSNESPVAVPTSHEDLLARAIPVVLVTLMPDGRPQASVVWVAYRDGQISLNTEAGRQKVRNMNADPRVTLLIVDPDDQHRYLELRCDVVAMRTEGALEHRAELDRQYLGPDHWTDPVGDRDDRLIIDLEPVRVNAYG